VKAAGHYYPQAKGKTPLPPFNHNEEFLANAYTMLRQICTEQQRGN